MAGSSSVHPDSTFELESVNLSLILDIFDICHDWIKIQGILLDVDSDAAALVLKIRARFLFQIVKRLVEGSKVISR
jgi:hypothetical protein